LIFSIYLSFVKRSLRWKIAQFLEVKWWKKYLSDKDPEAYLLWKKNYWKELMHELSELALLPQDKILDAGCGPAGIFIALDDYEVKAIDPLLDEYQSLTHFQPERYPNVKFQNLAIEQLQEAQTFDAVFCLNAINHVSDIDIAYQKLCDAVKKDGFLIVSIDAHRSNVLKSIFKALPGDVLHPHQYNLEEYERFLTDKGFVIVQTLLKTPGNIFDYYVQVAKKIKD
jgi:2-polyprenyl-3-methyl-5-hydroxy-6-metoxy-1,4-benzoquinol methylase